MRFFASSRRHAWTRGLSSLAIAMMAASAPAAMAVPAKAEVAAPAPLSSLVAAVDIPYEQFTLKNRVSNRQARLDLPTCLNI